MAYSLRDGVTQTASLLLRNIKIFFGTYLYIKSIYVTFIFLSFGVFAQEPSNLTNQNSLFKLVKSNFGGYGGPHFKFTKINGEPTVLGGGPIALVIKPNLAVFLSANYLEADVQGIEMGYGGIGAEYTLLPEKRFQLLFNGQIGYGKILYQQEQEGYHSGIFVCGD